jgi:hypothetical protein
MTDYATGAAVGAILGIMVLAALWFLVRWSEDRKICPTCGEPGRYVYTQVGAAWHLDVFECGNGHRFNEAQIK